MLGTGWTEVASVAAAYLIAVLATPAGVSGAVLLLPFQVSVLGTPSPAVTPTNLLYNVVSTPGALYRYWRQGQTGGPLTAILIAGTMPGVIAGSVIRVELLPGPRVFDLVVASVLLPLGAWLAVTGPPRPAKPSRSMRKPRSARPSRPARPSRSMRLSRSARPLQPAKPSRSMRSSHSAEPSPSSEPFPASGPPPSVGPSRTRLFPVPALVVLAAAVGCVGGIYGIGGGSILAPILIGSGRKPAEVAPAALASTFATSVAGVITFLILSAYQHGPVAPDWPTGIALGAGGLAGAYTGARLQSRLPEALIRRLIGVVVIAIATRYLTSGLT